MRITTKDGAILNPRFLREIRFDDEQASVTAIGEDDRQHEIDPYPFYEWKKRELKKAFDPVIPGSGVLLIASQDPRLSSEPTLKDLRVVEFTIIGWRITGEGGAEPVTAAMEDQGEVIYRAIKEVDGWALLSPDGLHWDRRLRDRTEFEYHALGAARSRWRVRVERESRKARSPALDSPSP